MPTAEELISVACIRDLARVLAATTPSVRWTHTRKVAATLGPLGLSDRARTVRDALLLDLPGGYQQVAEAVRAALQSPALTGWMLWPVTEAVATAACDNKGTEESDFEDGLALLAQLTPRLTSEFAIRTFLLADLHRALDTVLTWTAHEDPAVRRLASEGTRPRLPWAKRVPALFADPSVTIPILDRLYEDPSDVVRRSVANHLNDVSRLDPDLAVRVAQGWVKPDVVRHAMRTLVKQGNPAALELLGFSGTPESLTVVGPVIRETEIQQGGEVLFEATIANGADHAVVLAVDYVVHFRKANGGTAPKVFKLAKRTLAAGERMHVTRRHSFREITTRRHYPGAHAVELQVNGHRYGHADFKLG